MQLFLFFLKEIENVFYEENLSFNASYPNYHTA